MMANILSFEFTTFNVLDIENDGQTVVKLLIKRSLKAVHE